MKQFLFGLFVSIAIFIGYMVYVGNVDLEFKFGYQTANQNLQAQLDEIAK